MDNVQYRTEQYKYSFLCKYVCVFVHLHLRMCAEPEYREALKQRLVEFKAWVPPPCKEYRLPPILTPVKPGQNAGANKPGASPGAPVQLPPVPHPPNPHDRKVPQMCALNFSLLNGLIYRVRTFLECSLFISFELLSFSVCCCYILNAFI